MEQTAEQVKELLLKQGEELEQEIIGFRREIHKNPETGKSLPRTKEFVMKKLREFGYEPREICESGIVAEISGPDTANGGKTLLLRADMDALPVLEQADCEFKSTNGRMHACGHDMHAAMLLGAAKLLKQNQNLLEGAVKLVFQPDEEGFTGAKSMIAAGALENPKVDAGIALHVNSGTPSGMILCGKGICMAGCTLFRIVAKGKGCHGAMPETGVDPVNIAAHIYLSLQEITARELGAQVPAVVTIGKFNAGDVPNVIPGEAIMEGTIRTLDRKVGETVFNRICEISQAVAKTFRGEAQVTEIASAPPLINDREMVDEVTGYARDLVGEKAVYVYEGGGMGSEDFSSYTYEIPCSYMLIGAGTKEENPLYGMPMHNEKVFFNEAILKEGAVLHTYSAIMWLRNHRG